MKSIRKPRGIKKPLIVWKGVSFEFYSVSYFITVEESVFTKEKKFWFTVFCQPNTGLPHPIFEGPAESAEEAMEVAKRVIRTLVKCEHNPQDVQAELAFPGDASCGCGV